MNTFYQPFPKQKHYNPVVETMNNNYQSIYQNFDPGLQYNDSQSSQESTNQNAMSNSSSNSQLENNFQNNQNNSQAQQSQQNQNFQQNNNQSTNAIANLLGSLGSGNNYMDIIKNIAGGNFSGDKNQMILNLLSNMNNKTSTQNKKNTTSGGDFSNLTSIDDYNFID
ncbi:MAG: hypothetical protein ACI4TI_01125 [Christensenellales bacterium]